MSRNLQILIHAASAGEACLPGSPPPTLTRNFMWVLLFCLGMLGAAPLLIGWTASWLLNGVS